jgi:hypothetical protein
MKFTIHFEFRTSLRKFQDLNFWDAIDNASSNSAVMLTLSHMLAGYLGAYVDSTDPSNKTYSVLHQRCCGGQISPGSTKRGKDLTKGPRA